MHPVLAGVQLVCEPRAWGGRLAQCWPARKMDISVTAVPVYRMALLWLRQQRGASRLGRAQTNKRADVSTGAPHERATNDGVITGAKT